MAEPQQPLTVQQALDLAVKNHTAGRLPQADEIYRQVLKVKPDHPVALHLRGLLLHQTGHDTDGLALMRRAVAVRPDYAAAHNNLGNVLKDTGAMDEAMASYRQAIAAKPDFAEAHNNLGVALKNIGQLDEAIACFRQALAARPDFAEAHRHLATSRRFTAPDDDIRAMEAAYAQAGLADRQRMHLAFGLGKAYEDLGQYEKAFGFFADGNALMRAGYDYSIAAVEQEAEALKRLFTRAFLAERAAAGASDDTPIFVLGMPRSGTSLVEQILASHPLVFGAGELVELGRVVDARFANPSDPDFVTRIAEAAPEALAEAGRDYVGRLRRRNADAAHITDKLPGNFWHVGLIRLMLPNAKIVHCRRDPRDTCLSIFKNFFSGSALEYACDLEELGRYHKLYEGLMDHWHAVLPGYVHDIQYETLVADQEAETRRLLAFCGLGWDDACLEFHKTKRSVRTASDAQVRRRIYQDSVALWQRYETQLAPLLKALAEQERD